MPLGEGGHDHLVFHELNDCRHLLLKVGIGNARGGGRNHRSLCLEIKQPTQPTVVGGCWARRRGGCCHLMDGDESRSADFGAGRLADSAVPQAYGDGVRCQA